MSYKPKTHGQKANQPRPPDDRPSASARGYGSRWRKLRRMALARCPLCVECEKQGFLVPAEHVDHIIPLSAGGDNSLENLQGLCQLHHNQKTAKDKQEGKE